MPAKNYDLHGMAPDKCAVALILLDVINDFEFEGSEGILAPALAAAKCIVDLKKAAEQHGVPSIYVNDNYGRWKSNFHALIEHCIEENTPGKEIVSLLRPAETDYFVLKPKHSGFYSTTLDVLLDYLGVETLIITGFAGNICVLFTANDAYMRDYKIWVPSDCTASNTSSDNEHALRQINLILKADVRLAGDIDFDELAYSRSDRA